MVRVYIPVKFSSPSDESFRLISQVFLIISGVRQVVSPSSLSLSLSVSSSGGKISLFYCVYK